MKIHPIIEVLAIFILAGITALIVVAFEDKTIYVNNEVEQNYPFNPCSLNTVTCDNEREEWQTAEASAYTSRPEETDDTPCISANGMDICQYDGCIVATNHLPLNTYIEIEGFGKCLVADRMNRRYTYNIDIYFIYYQDAINFGRKSIKFWKKPTEYVTVWNLTQKI